MTKREPEAREACSVCFDRVIDVWLVPCLHSSICTECAQKCRRCPFCQREISKLCITLEEAEDEARRMRPRQTGLQTWLNPKTAARRKGTTIPRKRPRHSQPETTDKGSNAAEAQLCSHGKGPDDDCEGCRFAATQRACLVTSSSKTTPPPPELIEILSDDDNEGESSRPEAVQAEIT